MVNLRSGSTYRESPVSKTSSSRNKRLEPSIELELVEGDIPDLVIPVVITPMANPADAMMAPRGLPIMMPPGLAPRPMPVHLPNFSGMAHEDPSNHIERYIEALVTNVIPEETYRLVWFSTTLEGAAYDWYRSHAPDTFADWPSLQTAFLRQFRPETGQQNALVALTGMRQGPTEEISEYIRRFNTVVTRFVGNHLTGETIRYYFIQGFNKQTTIREVLNAGPNTVDEAQEAARHVERIERENNRMWNRTVAPVPSFIPAHYVPPQPAGPQYGESSRGQPYGPGYPHPVPIDSRPPAPQLQWYPQPEPATAGRFAEMEERFKKANDDLKMDMMNTIKSLGDQLTMAINAKNTHAPPPPNETGNYPTNIWCRNCNSYGHSEQFCPSSRNFGPYVPPQVRTNPPNPPGGGQPQPKGVPCGTCHRMHPLGPGICWVESGVVCGNCGGNHPTDKCRRPQKASGPVPGAGGSNTLNPPHNFFYDKPAQGPQQGYHVSSGLAPWYPQPSVPPLPQPPSQGLGPSNVSAQYYMGIQPVPPNSPWRPVYPPPGVSQDA